MNLVQIGHRSLNMDLVALIEDSPSDPGAEPGGVVTVILATGSNYRFAGPEADLIRTFIRENSRPLAMPPEAGDDFSRDRGPGLLPESDCREEGS